MKNEIQQLINKGTRLKKQRLHKAEEKAKTETKKDQQAHEEFKKDAVAATRNYEYLATWWKVQIPLCDFSSATTYLFMALTIGGLLLYVGLFFGYNFISIADNKIQEIAANGASSSQHYTWLNFTPYLLFFFALIGLWSYIRFRSWRSRLSFALDGWQTLVDAENFGHDESWRSCSLKIIVKKHSPQATQAIESALLIFTKRAHHHYYGNKESSEDRKQWEVNGLEASGSSNRYVAREIKKLCEKELSIINKNLNCIKAVSITIGDDRAYLPRYEPTTPFSS